MDCRALNLATSLLLVTGLSVGCGDDGGGGGADDSTGTSTGGEPVTTSGAEGSTGPAMVGEPPPTPQIVSPANGDVDVGTANAELASVDLCWTPVEDPEGNRVRYRVWLDSIELTEGKLAEEPGYEGPCLGPLDMTYDTDHTWQVQAFEADFLDDDGMPTSTSGLSDIATFTTIPDGNFTIVFEDDFEDDDGWTVDGDAMDGNWVHGAPEMTQTAGNMSQPGNCAGGDGCWFTGHNPGGDPTLSDVGADMSTSLTSPPFDLTGYETMSVEVNRFFYKQNFPETGSLFRVELVIPDPAGKNGEAVFVLEQLEQQTEAGGANFWTPTELVGCELPMSNEARIRFVATDLGEGVLEAAVDNVVVKGWSTSSLCDDGEGSVCDPNNADACGDTMMCCAQGTVNKGVYRCETPVAALSYPDGGIGELGCQAPDIFPTDDGMQVWEADIFVPDQSCLLFEQCVGAPGNRHLLRFDTVTPNAGAVDLQMGVPSNHPDLFHFSECHGHYHFDGYAVYDLLDDQGNVVAEGHKQAFCLVDIGAWDAGNPGSGYGCANQGISSGWQDIYSGNLDCNWIDVTDTPPGNYTLRISINPPPEGSNVPLVIESNYDNNVLEVPVTLTGA